MAIRERLSGNEAVAFAMRQIDPDVVAAFPITPSTEVPQYFSQFVANGQVHTEFVAVESEHSAMSACIGAEAAGARTMTATSSQGLALMWEMLYIAASMRLPIVMTAVNRALSAPINIHNDHSDAMGARDSGWIQIYNETNQEAYDSLIMAIRVAEHADVQLPVMVCYDGFITSHSVENIMLLEDELVKNFVGEYKPKYSLLDKEHPVSMGMFDLPAFYFEHKRQQAEAIKNAKQVLIDVQNEFAKISGRQYGLFEEYKLDDADIAIVIANSTAGTAKDTVDMLREQGIKAGLLKIRLFRPFPADEIAKALSHVKAVAVMDKAEGFSAAGGPIFVDVRSAMYGKADGVKVINYIYGLGGRDVGVYDIKQVYDHLQKIADSGQVDNLYNYLGIRE
ncbi:MAG: pyruvate ferredoxin oxidoreductase alpha subunit [Clostridiales bacterium]|jgi:pyruvate ferredoxin oxidoreductase alpha subunit|uniref:Pyruvate ferredoxin oxidoreductase, alpha subunit n=1 Tax=Mahella australiensis (strain DSM 15567 / CIP 107919 / 50-1 BON) TaxID=697281 RepID=F4A245_MAHA5|nr:2-ketoisovalerate ferredoxin oxidoreductase subunit alpha [Mahella australiensis]AEE97184.1 pyruvate ferredoxin oxidoreductase, alpha subunit [Mahella australiensis 50-1 BON]MDK2990822.1 pyruvate ferredoxin oxidoreductase alpha subunit [Clostridiales bacterium]